MATGFLARSCGRWVQSKEIAAQTGVAGPYLSQILHTLVKAGLVIAKRGYRGGFRLVRPAEEVTVMEVVEAMEKRSRSPRCLLGLTECTDHQGCPVHLLWKTTRPQVEARLSQLTLAEVAEAMAQRAPRAIRQTSESIVGVDGDGAGGRTGPRPCRLLQGRSAGRRARR